MLQALHDPETWAASEPQGCSPVELASRVVCRLWSQLAREKDFAAKRQRLAEALHLAAAPESWGDDAVADGFPTAPNIPSWVFPYLTEYRLPAMRLLDKLRRAGILVSVSDEHDE
jgi:hypothetical protein